VGLLDRILDVISRPQYAVMEGIRRLEEPGGNVISDLFGGAGAGLSGEAKTSFSDVLRQGGVEDPGVLGTIGDITLDPLNLLPVGAGVKLGRQAAAGRKMNKLVGVGKDVSSGIRAIAGGSEDPRKIFIGGSRTAKDPKIVSRILDEATKDIKKPETVISGGAPGADRLGAWWARKKGVKDIKVIRPDTSKDRFVDAARRRNAQAASESDMAILLWDGKSRGTHHMIDEFRRANKPMKIWNTAENRLLTYDEIQAIPKFEAVTPGYGKPPKGIQPRLTDAEMREVEGPAVRHEAGPDVRKKTLEERLSEETESRFGGEGYKPRSKSAVEYDRQVDKAKEALDSGDQRTLAWMEKQGKGWAVVEAKKQLGLWKKRGK
jgi:SLOG family YspA-like protein